MERGLKGSTGYKQIYKNEPLIRQIRSIRVPFGCSFVGGMDF